MHSEDELLSISALQHLAFCPRQWGLIHLEQVWTENLFTAEGKNLHDKTHEAEVENRPGIRIVRGLRLRSLRLGLVGQADVVEFHRIEGSDGKGIATAQTAGLAMTPGRQIATAVPPESLRNDIATGVGIRLEGVDGFWTPFPVEYKRGVSKIDDCDRIQLCAQALCLEEMLSFPSGIQEGALFYGRPRRREQVAFTSPLREKTEALAAELHRLQEAGQTPKAQYGKKCKSCSLLETCMPKVTGIDKDVAGYLKKAIEF